ncbi:MAG: hypothetical protein ACAI44_19260 [Candidatus Sericytochromatia bacterium]
MDIYQITIILQRAQVSFAELSQRLLSLMQAQTELPLFTMPDLPPGQAPIQIELRRKDVYLCCTVACESAAAAHRRLEDLTDRIQAEICNGLTGPFMEVAGFVNSEALSMQLELVLQGPACSYAVYHTGAVLSLRGHETIAELEDPFSPLFRPGGLRKLEAAETRQVLNSRQFQPVWTRRGTKRIRPLEGEDWFARHA